MTNIHWIILHYLGRTLGLTLSIQSRSAGELVRLQFLFVLEIARGSCSGLAAALSVTLRLRMPFVTLLTNLKSTAITADTMSK